MFQFGQRENMVQQKYVTPKEFFKLYNDESVTLLGWDMVTQDDDDQSATMLLRYKMADDFAQPLKNTNVILAAFVTAHARLRLYSYLEKLQDRVLYFDTGKTIFYHFFMHFFCIAILFFRFCVLHVQTCRRKPCYWRLPG